MEKTEGSDCIVPAASGSSIDSEFRLTTPSPGEVEEKMLLAAMEQIDQENQRRSLKHGHRQPLLCFSCKLPIAELRAFQQYSSRWKIKQTDLARFLLKSIMPLLAEPTGEVRKVLEANRQAEQRREEMRKRRRNPLTSEGEISERSAQYALHFTP